MTHDIPATGRMSAMRALAVGAALAALAAAPQARVTRIVVDDVKPLATAIGQTITYEQISSSPKARPEICW